MALGSLVVELSANVAKFQADMGRAVSSAQKSGQDISSAFTGVKQALGALGVGAGFLALKQAFGAIKDAVIEAEIASKRLDAVFKSTGGAVGFTRQKLDEFAESLAKTTIFDDEAFRNAEAELIKFGNIQGKVFTDALKLSADVASFMGTDLPAAAAQLGKSLVDPETAFGLLKKAGVALTDAQKESIKTFERLGDTAGAQGVILEQLKKTFGGAAETLNTGLTGATKELAKQWDELLETLGKTGPNAKIAEQSILGLANIFKVATGALEDFSKARKKAFDFRLSQAIPKTEQQLLNDQISKLGPATTIGSNNSFKPIFTKEQLDQLGPAGAIGSQPPNPLGIVLIPKVDAAAAEKAKRDIQKIYDTNRSQEDRNRQVEFDIDWANIDQESDAFIKARDNIASLKAEFIELIDPVEKYRKKLEEIDMLEQANALSADQANEARFKINDAIDAQLQFGEAAKETNNIAKEIGLTFSSAFEAAIFSGKASSDVFRSLAEDIAKLGIRKYLTEPLLEAADAAFKFISASSSSSSSSGIGGFLSSIFGGGSGGGEAFSSSSAGFFDIFAKGGVQSGPGISAYSGQVVSSPTIFPFASGIGLMGEAGAEAILPLKRGSDGTLGVSGSGGITVNLVYNVDAKGAQTGVSAEIRTALKDSQDKAVERAISKVQDLNARGILKIS